MNLVDTLISMGYSLRHEGNGNYRVLGHSGLIVKENYWYHHSQNKGGGDGSIWQHLNITMIREDQYHNTEHLCAHSGRRPQAPSLQDQVEQLQALGRTGKTYLLKRGIDEALIEDLNEKGLLRQTARGTLAFLGYDSNKRVRCISKRTIDPRSDVTHLESRGSDKNYSFCFPTYVRGSTIVLTEGPIDALSIACIEHRTKGNGYDKTCKIATCGSPTDGLFYRIAHMEPKSVIIVFDNDDAGKMMTQQARQGLSKYGVPTLTKTLPLGKDPNDWLLAMKREAS